jgi:hypothetical protein
MMRKNYSLFLRNKEYSRRCEWSPDRLALESPGFLKAMVAGSIRGPGMSLGCVMVFVAHRYMVST